MTNQNTCFRCNGKLEEEIKITSYRGKSVLVNVLVCNKCNNVYTPLKEAEKARLVLNPGFFERIKNLFHGFNKIDEAILKGRIL